MILHRNVTNTWLKYLCLFYTNPQCSTEMGAAENKNNGIQTHGIVLQQNTALHRVHLS